MGHGGYTLFRGRTARPGSWLRNVHDLFY
jgi:hypothetical protein